MGMPHIAAAGVRMINIFGMFGALGGNRAD
jgi:hypothetical protein